MYVFFSQPRLAHEAGAGASCMNCKSACSGLDLHFWRKICKICKCSRDDHDVDDDEFSQVVLLFGSSRKFKQKSLRKYYSYMFYRRFSNINFLIIFVVLMKIFK